jgi:hypothetical protein
MPLAQPAPTVAADVVAATLLSAFAHQLMQGGGCRYRR